MITNPALTKLQFLIGAWDMELSGASFLRDRDAAVHGSLKVEWIEPGAALAMRMGDAATWIIGCDDSEPDYYVLYSDDRGIARVYRMSLMDRTWRIWRNTPEFSQRFDAEISTDRTEINGCWQKSLGGGSSWEHDFNVRYHRRDGNRSVPNL